MGSRPKRIDFAHAYQHVTSRGTNQWMIFYNDADRAKFLLLLARVCRRYDIEVVAYCLMGNHFHLVLYTPHANLSNSLRDVKSAYGTYHNQQRRRTGPVHGARFFSRVIRDEKQLLDVIRYVHRNAYDLDPNISLADYPWSSHGIYLGLRAAPPWLRPQIAQDMFGQDYQQIVEAPRPTDKVQNRRGANVHAPGARTLWTEASLSDILTAVAYCAECDIGDVHPNKRNGLVGIAILLATELRGFASFEIAEPYGFRSASAVRKQLQRSRTRLATCANTQNVYERAMQLLQRRQSA